MFLLDGYIATLSWKVGGEMHWKRRNAGKKRTKKNCGKKMSDVWNMRDSIAM